MGLSKKKINFRFVNNNVVYVWTQTESENNFAFSFVRNIKNFLKRYLFTDSLGADSMHVSRKKRGLVKIIPEIDKRNNHEMTTTNRKFNVTHCTE